MRPFTLGRLADVIRLTRVFRRISPDQLEEAMMVTRERGVELLKQAEEMQLVRTYGSRFYSTRLGSAFFEAYRNNDRAKLDNILSGYSPYSEVKRILSQRSAGMIELKKLTSLTEVAIELMLRLLQYVRDDLYSINEQFFISSKELPQLDEFILTLKQTYLDLSQKAPIWNLAREFIRVDKIAALMCNQLRLSLDNFSQLLENALESFDFIEIHSEVTGYQFMPFSQRKINQTSYRKCYLRLKDMESVE